MTWQIAVTLATILVAFLLFASERFRIDQVALLVPVVLLLAGVIDAEQAVSGFSNPATITVAAMLILSLGLVKTGAVEAIGRWMRKVALGGSRARSFVLCGVVAIISPFLNNTAVVAVFLPVFLDLAEEADEPPSTYLIPLSYAAILGGTVTLIGTSTNLVVWGMARNRGFDDLHLFSIAPLGLVYLLVGFVYLLTVGRRLLPRRSAPATLSEKYGVREFLSELTVAPDSPCVGRSLADLDWRRTHGVTIHGVRRGKTPPIWAPGGEMVLDEGDTVYVQAEKDELLAFADAAGLVTPARSRGLEYEASEGRLAEVLIPPNSRLAGHTLRELRFPLRYGATVLAIHHHGTPVRRRLSDRVLDVGDLLLVHGPTRALDELTDRRDFLLLDILAGPEPARPRTLVAVAILAAVVALAAMGVVSILPAAVVGVVLMLFTGCVTLDEVYRDMNWMVVFLLAGLIPLGTAMETSGAGVWLAGHLHAALSVLPAVGVIAGFYLFTSFLTEVLSNNAAAVILTPIALYTAADLGMNPYALLVAVMFGASASFMTPMGYQTNTMVYGPGGYRFTDFLRVGAPLNVLLLVVASLLIPIFWS